MAPTLQTRTPLLLLAIILTVAISAWWYFASKGNTLEHEIGKWIERSCTTTDQCILNLSDLTDFEWDRMFVFNEGYDIDALEKILGTRPTRSAFLERKIVFLKRGQIVHYEELPTNLEHNIKGQVYFDIPTGHTYEEYSSVTAIFGVERKNLGYGPYYKLTRQK